MRRTTYRVFLIGLLTMMGGLAASTEARAQGFISPFIGFDFGGDSDCPTFNSPCEDKSNNIGVAFGSLRTFGFEAELAYARNFFGDTAGFNANVLTFMSSLMVAPKIGPARPYVLWGLGLIKTRVGAIDSSVLSTSNNNLGWNFGGGLMIFFGDHVGIRGDLRKFSSFGDSGLLAVIPGTGEEIKFNRAAAAVVFAF